MPVIVTKCEQIFKRSQILSEGSVCLAYTCPSFPEGKIPTFHPAGWILGSAVQSQGTPHAEMSLHKAKLLPLLCPSLAWRVSEAWGMFCFCAGYISTDSVEVYPPEPAVCRAENMSCWNPNYSCFLCLLILHTVDNREVKTPSSRHFKMSNNNSF